MSHVPKPDDVRGVTGDECRTVSAECELCDTARIAQKRLRDRRPAAQVPQPHSLTVDRSGDDVAVSAERSVHDVVSPAHANRVADPGLMFDIPELDRRATEQYDPPPVLAEAEAFDEGPLGRKGAAERVRPQIPDPDRAITPLGEQLGSVGPEGETRHLRRVTTYRLTDPAVTVHVP